jgi:signal transduction histidine kinase
VPPRAVAGFAAAVGAILIAVLVYFVVIRDRDAKAAHVTQRSERILALQRLEDALTRSESAQRGYLLTREDRYLEAFRRAVSDVAAELDAVQAADVNGRASEALVALIGAKLAELRRGVEVREADGLAKAQRELQSGDGPWLTETIEAVRAEMEAVERAALGVQRRAWFGRVALADAVFLGANAILLALVIAAAFGVRAEIRRREERQREREQMLELQELILGIVSHDLRNPLSAIQIGATQLSRAALAPPHARIAALIHSSADRMERIIRDLLDYTRMRGRSGIPLSIRTTDMGEVCTRVLEEAALAGRAGAIELSREGDLSGEWDPDRLQQAVGNLVANALQYAPPGAPVRILAVGESAEVRVDVENDGPPIPPEEMRSLFDPFHRGARARNTRGGLGLGLFIVRSIVEAHGGTVRVESGSARPVTFTLHLPRARSEFRPSGTSPGLWRPTRSVGAPGDATARLGGPSSARS